MQPETEKLLQLRAYIVNLHITSTLYLPKLTTTNSKMPELTTSLLLADLTHLKTLVCPSIYPLPDPPDPNAANTPQSPPQALLLLRGPPPHTPSLPSSNDDADTDLVRAHEFLRLRAEAVGREELESARGDVEGALKAEEVGEAKKEGWDGMPRIVGGWGERWGE